MNKFTLVKLQSGQSRLAVALGWEKEIQVDIYHCVENQKLYKIVEGGFVEVQPLSLDELIDRTLSNG